MNLAINNITNLCNFVGKMVCVCVWVYLELLSHFLPVRISLTNISPILIKMVDFKNVAWATSFATRASRKFIYRASRKKSYCHTLFRVSVYLSIFGFMLCVCYSSASSLEWFIVQTGKIFQVGYPVDSPTNSTSANPIWYSAVKFTKSHSECYTNGSDWGAASNSVRLNCTNLTHFCLTAGRFLGSRA